MPEREEISPGVAVRAVDRWRNGVSSHEEDLIAEEIPIAMVYNGATFAVMMASPHDLDDFALGFSLTERLINDASQLLQLETHALLEGIELAIQVTDNAPGAHLDKERERLLPGRSGCGICGTRDLENAVRHDGAVGNGPTVSRDALELALRELKARQPMNLATGAVHAAAWADASGRILHVREDVGRHNALDKLIGAIHRASVDVDSGFALVTSRASYEMVTKAASAGITMLAAISAPTALAVELARSAGITLIGFARPGSHNVYTHPGRLLSAASD
ncbi:MULTISPECIES: formate dehydrogenase accessory sulfurtransferase FdhD [unclassified Dyella]|uniref:formate dehydrogenase accessory sulfurtransferase FdhD n=1 Tax=unclassified Dyella TaxID=2634549 RepID=UPI000CA7D046|nr:MULTISPECIES: formate dehydrogenase accessory sulfurtransferase FdhD [unclassified Dyella]MDR3446281.1 formate dehydrogenase accessory sulfurtransferase FdhD [Dyella sp.]PMQ02736.1 Protein FdhD [Dyella sp. AD56]